VLHGRYSEQADRNAADPRGPGGEARATADDRDAADAELRWDRVLRLILHTQKRLPELHNPSLDGVGEAEQQDQRPGRRQGQP